MGRARPDIDPACRPRHRLPGGRGDELAYPEDRDPRALLTSLDPAEVAPTVGFLSGAPRQGRVGVGYSTVYGVEAAPADHASLTITELDEAISELQRTAGSGSGGQRKRILLDLLGRATAHEADFVKRLLTGELRQGALAGVMIDAVAKAAGVPAPVARRALMLSGELTTTAEIALTTGEVGLRSVRLELFRPILPMLASTAESVGGAVADFERASVEWKLAGIRIRFTVAPTRSGSTRQTERHHAALPGVVEAVRGPPLEQAVLDGEALWRAGRPAAFQDTVSQIDGAAHLKGRDVLFDLLHVDGRICSTRRSKSGPPGSSG